MNLAAIFYPGQAKERARIKARLADCQPKKDWAFSPPVVSGPFARQQAEIRRELERSTS